jgi:hypothetical protein
LCAKSLCNRTLTGCEFRVCAAAPNVVRMPLMDEFLDKDAKE